MRTETETVRHRMRYLYAAVAREDRAALFHGGPAACDEATCDACRAVLDTSGADAWHLTPVGAPMDLDTFGCYAWRNGAGAMLGAYDERTGLTLCGACIARMAG